MNGPGTHHSRIYMKRQNPCIAFYDEKELLYLEVSAPGIGHLAGLLQVREGMTCPRNTIPHSSILLSMVLARKKLIGCWNTQQQHRKRSTRHTPWPTKIHHYCFAREAQIVTDQKPLVSMFKRKHSNIITGSTVPPITETPVLIKHNPQTKLRPLHQTAYQDITTKKEMEKIAGLHLGINTTDVAIDITACMMI